jgi:TetR/AcrR family transcriptional repressor of nem operon
VSDTKHALVQLVSNVFEDWTARIQEVVSAARESGEVRGDLSSEAIARHIVFAIEGGIMLSRLKKEETPLKDCLETLRELLLVGGDDPSCCRGTTVQRQEHGW